MVISKYFYLAAGLSLLLATLAHAELPSGTYDMVNRFRTSDGTLPPDYAQRVSDRIYDLLNKAEDHFLSTTNGNCIDQAPKVDFLKKIESSSDPVIQKFESNILRIEAVKCFSNTTSEKVLSTLSSGAFKKKAFSSLRSIETVDATTTCEKNDTPFIGKSSSCYKTILDSTNTDYLKSFSTNDNYEISKEFKVPVYMRQSLTTVRQVGQNVQLHSVTYARGPEFSFLKSFVPGVVSSTQDSVFKALADELKK